MPIDQLQRQRFELKFQIPESTARAVRDYLRTYLVPDQFGVDPDFPAYMVHSLYLDSSDLHLYRSTINGDRNRFKLRVRYYTDADAFVFLEIKRRADRCILKERALVRRECVAELIGGAKPARHHLAEPSATQLAALQTFAELRRRLHATPSAHLAYEREAWCSRGSNAVRVTFDRSVRCEAQSDARLAIDFREPPAALFPGRVILELKFTDRFPVWLQTLVDHFDLTQSGAAKYVDGIYTLGAVARPTATTPFRALRPPRPISFPSPFAASSQT